MNILKIGAKVERKAVKSIFTRDGFSIQQFFMFDDTAHIISNFACVVASVHNIKTAIILKWF